MSYDLHFVPRAAGSDIEAIEAFLEETEDEPASDESAQHEIVEALLALNPALERFHLDFEEIARLQGVSVEEARRNNNHVELNASEKTGIQIMLFTQQGSITVPYWHAGAAAEQVFAEVRTYADVLTQRGGYRIFDPQLERVADHFQELQDALLHAYSGVIGRMPGLASKSDEPKPWWRFW